MAKGNLFLGFARGKVGDTVFYRQYGEQCSRARNRHPSNPQSPLQLLQRVCMKTCAGAYSMLQDITNHSFQGRSEGTESQSRFTRLNIAYFRNLLSGEINSGDPMEILASQQTNFATKSASLPEVNPYVISEGSMQPLDVRFIGGLFGLCFTVPQAGATAANLTYQNVVDGLGLSRGDQITFLVLSVDDRDGENIDLGHFNSFRYARVILEPNDADMTSLFFNDGAINKPNARNQGSVSLAFQAAAADNPAYLTFAVTGIDTATNKVNSAGAAAVVSSRLANSVWLRSTQALVLRPSEVSVAGHLTWDHSVDTLADAIASFMTTENSALYLNQAENF